MIRYQTGAARSALSCAHEFTSLWRSNKAAAVKRFMSAKRKCPIINAGTHVDKLYNLRKSNSGHEPRDLGSVQGRFDVFYFSLKFSKAYCHY